MDKNKPLPRMPRADTSLEDYYTPEARFDMAALALHGMAAPDDTNLCPPALRAPVFHKPAAPIAHARGPKQAGFFMRGAAVVTLASFFTVLGMGYDKDGAKWIRETVCALPFTNCAPR